MVIPVFSLYSETEQFPLSPPEGRSLDRLCPVPEKREIKKSLNGRLYQWMGRAGKRKEKNWGFGLYTLNALS